MSTDVQTEDPLETLQRRPFVVASMCTMPGRQDSLAQAVGSLVPQIDELHIYFNGFDKREAKAVLVSALGAAPPAVPPLVVYSGSASNRGDAMKFLGAPRRFGEGVIRLICDDDLVYPEDYAQRMVEELHRRPHAVISAHGSRLTSPFRSYYRSRKVYHCTAETPDVAADVLGTGCMAYRGGLVFRRADFPSANMADIWAAIRLRKDGIETRVIAHDAGWLRLADPGNPETIYEHSRRGTGTAMDTAAAQTEAIRQHASLFCLTA